MACDALDEGFDSAVTGEFWNARSAFAETVPTTPAGLVAFAAYVNEAQTRMCSAAPYFDTAEDAEAFSATLDRAVRRMIGLSPSGSNADNQLAGASNDMQSADVAIDKLHKQFGDDADSRDDYHQLEVKRDEALAILAGVPAKTELGLAWLGLAWLGSKARVLIERRLNRGFCSTPKRAHSLALDVLHYFGRTCA